MYKRIAVRTCCCNPDCFFCKDGTRLNRNTILTLDFITAWHTWQTSKGAVGDWWQDKFPAILRLNPDSASPYYCQWCYSDTYDSGGYVEQFTVCIELDIVYKYSTGKWAREWTLTGSASDSNLNWVADNSTIIEWYDTEREAKVFCDDERFCSTYFPYVWTVDDVQGSFGRYNYSQSAERPIVGAIDFVYSVEDNEATAQCEIEEVEELMAAVDYPCSHRGKKVGDFKVGVGCGRRVEAVHDCKVHKFCSMRSGLRGVQACLSCKDRSE